LLRRGGAHLSVSEAVACGDISDLKLGLGRGVDPNTSPDGCETALAHAYAHLDELAVDSDGAHPRFNRLKTISLLRAYGARCGFHESVILGVTGDLKWHLTHGAYPNARLVGRSPVIFEAACAGTRKSCAFSWITEHVSMRLHLLGRRHSLLPGGL